MSVVLADDIAEHPHPPPGPSSHRRLRTTIVGLVTVAIAIAAFLFRFNAPEGSLGGFTNDQFAHLMRVEMLLRGQQPLRDFADAELRGAWPALSYVVPTWAQQIGGRTLLPEAVLTFGAIAIAHALLFPFVLALTQRWGVALLATAIAIATSPRAYSYPKVLVFALAVIVLRRVMMNPSVLAMGAAALVTAIATLFRHDCGVYVGAGLIAGIVALDPHPRIAGRRLGWYLGLTTLILLPSAIWVQIYEGIPSYIHAAWVTATHEATRTRVELPALWTLSATTSDGLVGLTYYVFWTVPAVAALLLAVRHAEGSAVNATDRGICVGLIATVTVANFFLLRGSLAQRLGDAAIPVVALGAMSIAIAASLSQPVVRRLVTVVPLALMVFLLAAASAYGAVPDRLDASGLTVSWTSTMDRFSATRDRLEHLPPIEWSAFDEDRSLPQAARYVAECTSPDDYLLVAAEAPEIHVFARRRFAAGQGAVSMGLYTSEADQRRALARLSGQSVPIVLAEAARYQSEFIWTYPLLAGYINMHYRQAGTIDDRFLVFVEANRPSMRTHPPSGLPCFTPSS